MRLHRLAPSLLLIAVLALWPQARPAAAAADPGGFMADLGNRVLKLVTDTKSPEAQRKQQFARLVEDSFDVPRITQFVLGRYWRTASDEEKKRFAAAFETYMTSVYWSRFQSYNGEGFKVVGTQDVGNGTLLVTTEISRPQSGQPPVKVSWNLVKSGDSYKIRDASLEGVSQALTYRDEFASIIERNNGQVSALIDQLNERAKG